MGDIDRKRGSFHPCSACFTPRSKALSGTAKSPGSTSLCQCVNQTSQKRQHEAALAQLSCIMMTPALSDGLQHSSHSTWQALPHLQELHHRGPSDPTLPSLQHALLQKSTHWAAAARLAMLMTSPPGIVAVPSLLLIWQPEIDRAQQQLGYALSAGKIA